MRHTIKTPFNKVKFLLSAVLFLAMALGLAMPTQPAWAIPAAPSTVWVDDTYDAASCTVAGHTFGVDCFAAIQGGVTAVSSGGTVNVAEGTYAESVNITIPGVTIVLSPGTVIVPSSPCFTVSASDTTLIGGVCEPSLGSNGVQTGAVVSNLVIKNMEIRNGTGTGDGIHLGHNVTNLQIINNYIHNMGGDGIEYAASTTVSGVHEVQGNLFQLNGGSGVNNASGNLYVVEYNSWNDIAGPNVGSGDGANGSLDFTPWTHVGLSVSYSVGSSPVANKVGEGYKITYNIKMDAAEVFGADFDLNYDSTKLSVVLATNGGSFTPRDLCTINTATPGVVSFCGSRTITALNGSAQPVFTVVFQGVASSTPGSVTLDLDGADDVFGMAPPSGASNNIYAAALTDGSVTVYDTTTVTGCVDLQGRANDSGAGMTFAAGTGVGYGPFVNTSTNSCTVSLSNVVWDTYPVTVSMARYLDVTVASGRSAAITADNQVLSTLVLLGGDAYDDDIIDISDATIIGGQFGNIGAGITDTRADINNDGTIDIFDLVLMGGNYGKTSATAYSGWTP